MITNIVFIFLFLMHLEFFQLHASANPTTSEFMNVIAYRTDWLLSWYGQAMRAYPFSNRLKIKAMEPAPKISGDYKQYCIEELPEILKSNELPYGTMLFYYIRGGNFYGHYGVYVGEGRVLHKTGKENRPQMISYRDFYRDASRHSHNKDTAVWKVIWENPLPEAATREAAENWNLERSEFNVFLDNCEHYATRLVLGVSYSEQVRAWAWLATTGAIITLPFAYVSKRSEIKLLPVLLPLGAAFFGVERFWMTIEMLLVAGISFRLIPQLFSF
jgi:Lecithin retinol acyltransferase